MGNFIREERFVKMWRTGGELGKGKITMSQDILEKENHQEVGNSGQEQEEKGMENVCRNSFFRPFHFN